MDFSLLPDPVFLQIFQYLPLEDCVRSGRVNKKFRRIAQLATSYTKSLDLNEDRFRNLNAYQFAVILDLCAPNLERIKFPSRDVLLKFRLSFAENRQRATALDNLAQQLAPIFPNYECPRLTDIDLAYASIDFTDFDRLVRNNPKLESLVWNANFVGFPNFTNNNLKKLNLLIENDAILQTLIGRCPNLQEFDLKAQYDHNITANVLDEFIASAPQIQRFNLQNAASDGGNLIRLESTLVNFWNLSLISLKLSFISDDYPDDNLFYKVARSFPLLKEFHIHCQTEPTDTGIACLGYLQELEVIELEFTEYAQRPPYDQGVRQLGRCKKLRKFGMGSSYIAHGSFVHLLQNCPDLKEIDIWAIKEVVSMEEVAAFLESLAGIPKRELDISFSSYGDWVVWDPEPVKAAIKMLEENHGLKVKFSWRWREEREQREEDMKEWEAYLAENGRLLSMDNMVYLIPGDD